MLHIFIYNKICFWSDFPKKICYEFQCGAYNLTDGGNLPLRWLYVLHMADGAGLFRAAVLQHFAEV